MLMRAARQELENDPKYSGKVDLVLVNGEVDTIRAELQRNELVRSSDPVISRDIDHAMIEVATRVASCTLFGEIMWCNSVKTEGAQQLCLTEVITRSCWSKQPEMCSAICGVLEIKCAPGKHPNFLKLLDGMRISLKTRALLIWHIAFLFGTLRSDYNVAPKDANNKTISSKAIGRVVGLALQRNNDQNLKPADLRSIVEDRCGKNTRLYVEVAGRGNLKGLVEWIWTSTRVYLALSIESAPGEDLKEPLTG